MKRIGLHTITDYVNYGNRLQNYAAQEVLKSFGFEVESIINYPTRPVEKGFAFTLIRIKNAYPDFKNLINQEIIFEFIIAYIWYSNLV